MRAQTYAAFSVPATELAEALDEVADLCSHWQRNRRCGRMPTALQGALLAAMHDALRTAKEPARPVLDWNEP